MRESHYKDACVWSLVCREFKQKCLQHSFKGVNHVSSAYIGPCGSRGHCRISPPRFLDESHKRRLNQGSFVSAVCLVVFFFDLYCIYVFFMIYIEYFPYCLFVSNSQVIGCEDRLQNDLYCVGWGVKLYSINQHTFAGSCFQSI